MIKIVTDSSVQLTEQEIESNHINIIPLTITIDGQSYVDDRDITRDEFMQKMATAKTLPKTSQPALGTFVDLFNKLGADGSQVLAIHMMRAISGTVETARQAAQMSDSDVTVIDSDFTDRAMGFQVLAAAKLANEGADMDTVLTKVKQVHDHTKLCMGIVDLNNMVKGGRLSKVAGIISNLLNIKVVLDVNKTLEVIRKGRGMKTINKFIDDFVDQMKQTSYVAAIGISHADALNTANSIKDKLQPLFPNLDILVRTTDPVIATHSGAGAFAVMYYTDED